MKSLVLDCADDSAAIESAKQLVDGHDIELWQRDPMIGRFDGKAGRGGLIWRMCDQTALRYGEISQEYFEHSTTAERAAVFSAIGFRSPFAAHSRI